VRVGVIGCGYIANKVHLPVLLEVPEAEVIALCDTNEAAARTTALNFGIRHSFSDSEEMLQVMKLDLVDICTPTDLHAITILQALAWDVDCLVEKPLTTTLADADRVIERAQQKGLGIYVIHNISTVMPSIMEAKRIVESGMLGDLLGIDLRYLVPIEPRHLNPHHWLHRLPGGILAEVMPHMLMIVLEFLKDVRDVKVVCSKRSAHPFIRVDEIRVLLEGSNGLGSLTIAHNCPSRRTALDVIGTRMSLSVDADSQAVVIYPAHPGTEATLYRGWRALSEIAQRTAALAKSVSRVAGGRYLPLTHGHRYLIRRAALSVVGREPYPIDVSKAREVVSLAERIFHELPHAVRDQDISQQPT
jgi:predicted dehydrogenase